MSCATYLMDIVTIIDFKLICVPALARSAACAYATSAVDSGRYLAAWSTSLQNDSCTFCS